MNQLTPSLYLLASVILPKARGEKHLALFVQDVAGEQFLRIQTDYSSVRCTGERWIWIDWRQAFKFLAHWIRKRYRCTMQRLLYSLRLKGAAPTGKSKSTSESAMHRHLGPSTASVKPADTEKHPSDL